MTQLAIVEKFQASHREYLALEKKIEAAWGDTGDGKSAKPQALQLADRIALGEMMLTDNDDPGYQTVVKRKLLVLQRELARAESDPQDAARCYEFRQLEEQFNESLATCASLYDQAREVLGDDGALMERDPSDGHAVQAGKEGGAQGALFFTG